MLRRTMSMLLALTLGCQSKEPTVTDPSDASGTTTSVNGVTAEVSFFESLVLASVVHVTSEPPSPVTLICTSPDDEDEQFVMESDESAEHTFELFGLLQETAYACDVWRPADVDAPAAQVAFVTEAVPFYTPVVEIRDSGGRYGSYTLFNHWRKSKRIHRLMLYDLQGRIRWYWVSDGTTGGFESRLLPDGTILAGGAKSVNPGRLNLAGDFAVQMPDPDPVVTTELYHHEATLGLDGQLVGLSTTEIQAQGQSVVVFKILAYDPASDEITFQWSAEQALNAGTFRLPDDLEDPYHANALQWVDDERGEGVWVSMKGVSRLARIDVGTGDVTDVMGVNTDFTLFGEDGQPLDDAEWFRGQHAPRFSGDRLILYNNGASGPLAQTKVEQYRVDLAEKTLTREWMFSRSGWYEPYYGEGDWLPNGNIMVASGHCNNCTAKQVTSFIAEVDVDTREILWEMSFPNAADSIYRAQLIDGCELFHTQRFCQP